MYKVLQYAIIKQKKNIAEVFLAEEGKGGDGRSQKTMTVPKILSMV